MRPQTAEQGCAGGRANWLGYIGTLEDDRLGSQFVQGRSVNLCSSVAGNGIGSLLIREKYEQVRWAHRFFRLIKHSSSGSLASKSSFILHIVCCGLIARLRQPKSANSENRPLFGLRDVGVRSLANSAERTKSLPFEVRVNDLKILGPLGRANLRCTCWDAGKQSSH